MRKRPNRAQRRKLAHLERKQNPWMRLPKRLRDYMLYAELFGLAEPDVQKRRQARNRRKKHGSKS